MKKKKKFSQYCEERLRSESKNILSNDEIIRIMKSDSDVGLCKLKQAKKRDIDNYVHMIINTAYFAEKYEYLLSLYPLSDSFYRCLAGDANEKCFKNYICVVKRAIDKYCQSSGGLSVKKSEVWGDVGRKYQFSLVVSMLIERKREDLLNILLKYYNLTSEEECLLLGCYIFYEDSDFLKSYFSKYVLWPKAFDRLCCPSYNSLYKLYYEANHGKVPLKYRLIRWKRKLAQVFFH